MSKAVEIARSSCQLCRHQLWGRALSAGLTHRLLRGAARARNHCPCWVSGSSCKGRRSKSASQSTLGHVRVNVHSTRAESPVVIQIGVCVLTIFKVRYEIPLKFEFLRKCY